MMHLLPLARNRVRDPKRDVTHEARSRSSNGATAASEAAVSTAIADCSGTATETKVKGALNEWGAKNAFLEPQAPSYSFLAPPKVLLITLLSTFLAPQAAS